MRKSGITLSAGKYTIKLSVRKLIRIVWFTAGAIFMGWLVLSYQARGVDESVIKSSSTVKVDITTDYFIFTPVQSASATALIFYPGGMVDPEAYTPLGRSIAGKGFKVIIVKMPFRMAGLGYEKAKKIISGDHTVKKWVLAGHSLGGAKAAQFAFENPALLYGLILMGTSHPRDIDLSTLTMDITKIYASQDGIATVEKVKANAKYLPSHTHWVLIEGGNHAQFGWYGTQLGDNDATISRHAQQDILVREMVTALRRVSVQ